MSGADGLGLYGAPGANYNPANPCNGREPALEAIILAPAESRFRRVEGKFVAG